MPRSNGHETPEHRPRERVAAGAAGGDAGAPPYVRLTQRERPPRSRRRAWLLVAAVVAAHVLLAWIAWFILRPVHQPRDEREVFRITLIEPTSELPPPPPLVPPPPLPGQPPAAPPRRLHYVPPAQGAISATLEGVKGPPLELYESNGQIHLPSGTAQKPAPAYSAPGIKGSQIYSGKSPVPYKPTRFNKDWAPVNESLGAKTVGRAFDKAVEATTLKKTVHLPGGGKLHCAISPLLLFAAGCSGDEPPPPPKNDNDIRLSMPPAETLTGKKVPVPDSASSAAKPASASTAPAPASSAAPAASTQPSPAAASSR